jgi:hypothetical protein
VPTVAVGSELVVITGVEADGPMPIARSVLARLGDSAAESLTRAVKMDGLAVVVFVPSPRALPTYDGLT